MARRGSKRLRMEMITMRKVALVVMVLVAVGLVGAHAVSLCGMTEDDLDECRPAVSGSEPSDPTEACCTALSKADLTCLCGYKESPVLPMLGIKPELAMQLPSKCNLTPPAQC
ncbi:putative lipid-transfer protein DIR1 [Magnolia sinica]|uniref:putative lipid-transfer protein DIR1 n=1 Tax=Magnolia sinica TaxID=86752 RepID=UPI00265850B1|nr:putative lipid-transfer protein DIR1 [Magnolia sinica]